MGLWNIRFLGVPNANDDDRQAHLRSKETWAVLASLVVPAILRNEAYTIVARDTLADRFWGDSLTVVPRTHLRQCIASLRDTFGESCVIASRQDISIAPGWFTTDLELALTSYQKALVSSSLEERLHWLMRAEEEIRGEFFEGWTPKTEEAQIWLIHLRANIQNRLLPILLLLAKTLEESNHIHAAFDIARKALQFQSDNQEVQQLVWRLAVSTGQQQVVYALEQTRSFREALSKISTPGLKRLTLHDGRIFQSLFMVELQGLPAHLSESLLRLSVLPSLFTPELAEMVCRVSARTLRKLSKTPFVEHESAGYSLPSVIRECASKQLPTATRRLLQKRLADGCMRWLRHLHHYPAQCTTPFSSLDQASPFLIWSGEWVVTQVPTREYIDFMNLLRHHQLLYSIESLTTYYQRTQQDENLSKEIRLEATLEKAYLHMQLNQHKLAVVELEMGLPLATSLNDERKVVYIYGLLMRACHYAGDSQSAISYAFLALTQYKIKRDTQRGAEVLRFLGEISNHTGDFEQALQYCAEAVQLRRADGASDAQIADALYWQAKSLYQLGQWQETQSVIIEALSLWQRVGDTTGIGFCMRLLAQLRCIEKRFAEAQAHLEYAILLHDQTGNEGNRIAAIEVLGDVYHASRRKTEADCLYGQCLGFYKKQGMQASIDRLHTKIEAMGIPEIID